MSADSRLILRPHLTGLLPLSSILLARASPRVTARYLNVALRVAQSLLFRNDELTLHAISFSGYADVKRSSTVGVVANVYFYGDDLNCLAEHVHDHLRHLVATTYHGSNSTDTCLELHLLVHFPLSFNSDHVDSLIRAKQQRETSDRVKSTVDCLEFMELSKNGEIYMAREQAIRVEQN